PERAPVPSVSSRRRQRTPPGALGGRRTRKLCPAAGVAAFSEVRFFPPGVAPAVVEKRSGLRRKESPRFLEPRLHGLGTVRDLLPPRADSPPGTRSVSVRLPCSQPLRASIVPLREELPAALRRAGYRRRGLAGAGFR